jgi:GAF domain-containing protein
MRADGIVRAAAAAALAEAVDRLRADSGTVHWLEEDGLLHLVAATAGLPEPVLAAIRTIPVGKGMAGLAVEREVPVSACNIQTDESGDVRPGARATGLGGAVVVPILGSGKAVGALGIGTRLERDFSPPEIEDLCAIARILAKSADGPP